MKVGIIGTGPVGKTLATKLAERGYPVLLANSRGPEAVSDSLGATIADVAPSSTSEVLGCDLVILSVPWTKVLDVLGSGGPKDGRILVDATNIFLTYQPDARVNDLKGDSGSEIVARSAPAARVVKAFNTLPVARMFAPPPKATKRVLFVAGDDASAVAPVAALIADIGLHPVPLGSLSHAGRQMELGGPLSGLELLTPSEDAA